MKDSLHERINNLIRETIAENTDTLVAIYHAEHPEVPISDVMFIVDATASPLTMFRVERRPLMEELIELKNKVRQLEVSLMGGAGKGPGHES